MQILSRFLATWAKLPTKNLRGRVTVTAAVHGICSKLIQGDVVMTRVAPEARAAGASLRLTPFGAAIVSQTCDLVLRKSSNIVLSVIANLSPTVAAEARAGSRPRYVHLPELGDDYFADLDHIFTLHKSRLAKLQTRSGLGADAKAQRRFAQLVARRFSRFPFPDDVVPHLSPLRDVLGRAARRTNSTTALVDAIGEIRIEGAWESGPVALTLHIIVNPEVLPIEPDEPPTPSPALAQWLGVPRTIQEVALRLFPVNGSPPAGDDRIILWWRAAEALAELCKPSSKDVQRFPTCAAAVTSVVANLATDEEFTLAQTKRTEILDLAHLSDPPQLAP